MRLRMRHGADALKLLLRRQLDKARRQTDSLFDIIDPAAFYERPIAERHRIIFYLGHFEAFDWNMVCGSAFEMKAPDETLTRLFSFGIDPIGGGLPADQASDWPRIEAVRRYNAELRWAVDDCLEKVDFSKCEQRFVENGLIFWTAIEHRLMHAETLTYMLHWLPFDQKHPQGPLSHDSHPAPEPRQTRVPDGPAILGQQRSAGQFGWDNEFEAHHVHVPAFDVDVYKVTNAQYLQFVRAGGYSHRSLWTDSEWNWIRANGIQCPKFWLQRRDRWCYRGMFGEVPLPLSWPVYVSYAEASAYARWAGKSLPTEAEFDLAAFGSGSNSAAMTGNFGFERWDPLPVDHYANATTSGIVEPIGNGWEWTSTPFGPFEGFQHFPFYPGYSADFFDQNHFVLKGASARTDHRLTRRSFRNWFQPFYPHIYAGFRCVQRQVHEGDEGSDPSSPSST